MRRKTAKMPNTLLRWVLPASYSALFVYSSMSDQNIHTHTEKKKLYVFSFFVCVCPVSAQSWSLRRRTTPACCVRAASPARRFWPLTSRVCTRGPAQRRRTSSAGTVARSSPSNRPCSASGSYCCVQSIQLTLMRAG